MRNSLIFLLSVGCSLSVTAQFYPQANAVWCGQNDDGGPPGFSVQFEMANAPVTLINNLLYQKVEEYNDAPDGLGYWNFVRSYYVRSDVDGKGYVYLPDSAAEFLSGDIAAQAGDTVHDVLESITNSSDVTYYITDVVVDSVTTLSNAGISVVRHYLKGFSDVLFWQAGMGTSSGPVLEMSGIFGLCGVGDTIMYALSNDGLPGPAGINQICWPISLGFQELSRQNNTHMKFTPNPSTGIFTLSSPTLGATVYTSTGQELLKSTGQAIDLSAYPPGPYHAVVRTAQGVGHVRLMVVR